MRHRFHRYAALWLSLLAVIGACQKPRSSIIVPEQPKTVLRVTNGEFLDAVIYVVNRGQRVRLGVANANRTTRFEIPKHLLFGATALSFLVDPIGGNSRPSTGDMVIDPGDELELHLNGGRLLLTKR